ncbi:MAG: hypothetical protein QNL36_04100 [Crocinitomicaceae bacterium]|tara:strand:+ start:10408 stop:12354 length:1947 start_codon:yes stop_codon:yes gene_type:complete
MSNPSFSNIDLWLFELAEGNLSPAQITQLESFLLQNPELDVDRDLWDMSSVSAMPVVYPNQKGLGRGNSKRRFAFIGLLPLLFITSSVGFIGYFSSDESEVASNKTIQTASIVLNQTEHNQLLLNEIDDLKSTIVSLENKITSSKSSRISEVLNDHFTNGSSTSNRIEEQHDNKIVESNPKNGVLTPERQGTNANQGIDSNQRGQGVSANTTPNLTFATNVPALNVSSIGNTSANTIVIVNTNANNSVAPILVPNEPPAGVNEPLLGLNELNVLPEARGLLAKKTEKQLETRELERLESPSNEVVNSLNSTSKSDWKSIGVSEYNNSFKNRMAGFGRNFRRMMDNPIALKNSRDPHFHVPGKSSQDLNFGSVGTLIALRVQTLSRMQWYGQANEQFSNQLSIDGYSYALRGGLGIQLNHSIYNRGGLQVSDATFTYSPKISVSRKISVEPSFRFKMGGKFLNDQNMGNASQVEFDRGNVQSYYNDTTAPVGKNLLYKDLGIGLNVNTKWFFMSAQVDNIFNHRDNLYSTNLADPRRAGTQFVSTIGTDLDSRDESMTFSPYMVYQKIEQLSEAWLGFNYRFEWFTVGGAISSNLEPAASIGVKFKHFSMHVNSDYTNSLMTSKKVFSHQVTLRFLGKPNRFGKRLLNL